MSDQYMTWEQQLKKRKARALAAAKCKTPGAFYSISVVNPPQTVSVTVTLPATVRRMDQQEAMDVEKRLHAAVERVLARLFVKKEKP